MIDEEEFMDINALHRQGHTYAQIGRMVGRDWRTVKRYLTEGAQPVYRRQKDLPSKLDPFKEIVDGWLQKEPNLRATRIHQDLVHDYGFSGGYQIVQRYVRDLKAARDPRIAEERFESAPGHQAQVDWSHEDPILTPEGLALPLYCFHMVLSHSRDAFCSLVGSMDLTTFWGCHRAAFSHFGGVPREILYDRTKTVVRQHVGREQGLERRLFHPEALASAMHYGFRIRLCKPYRAKTKGKVESDVDYVRGRLLRAHSFRSYEEANTAWRGWNEEIARRRRHGTHGEIVCERAERDRGWLLALPPDPYLVVSRTQRTVARDGFFSFEGRRYAVPARLAKPGERVELVLGAGEVEVYSSGAKPGRLIASYERGRPKRVLPDPSAERGSVPLAEVLRALPVEEEVHRRPLSIYEEMVAGG